MFELPEDTPQSIRELPREKRGYPIPFFVATLPDGTRDLRFADARKKHECSTLRLCWVCGQRMKPGKVKALIGGPMSVCNALYSDFAVHPECATFSVKYCPHLCNASAKYRSNDMPEEIKCPVGAVGEHPGVIAIVRTKLVTTFEHGPDLFQRPNGILSIFWYYEGERIPMEEAIEKWVPPKEMPPRMARSFVKTLKKMCP